MSTGAAPSPPPAPPEAPSMPLIPMVKPTLEPDDALLDRIRGALASGHVTNHGPLVQELEREAARALDAPGLVAVDSGASGLLLAVNAANLPKGKAILPSFTYIATLASVTHSGLEPIFCDVTPDTFTMDPDHLAHLLATERDVRLVVPVSAYGIPPALDAIGELSCAAGASVIYDAAHAFGTVDHGARSTASPLASVYSLHATKVMPAVEGGLVLSADPALLEEVRRLRNHGLATDRLASRPGYNAKMDELSAAVALHSLARFEGSLARRAAYAVRLREHLVATAPSFYTVQRIPSGVTTNHQNLAVSCAVGGRGDIDAVVAAFLAHGIEARRYFWPALHHLDAWRGRFDLPVTDRLIASLVCLPLHSRMSDEDLSRIERAALAVAREMGS